MFTYPLIYCSAAFIQANLLAVKDIPKTIQNAQSLHCHLCTFSLRCRQNAKNAVLFLGQFPDQIQHSFLCRDRRTIFFSNIGKNSFINFRDRFVHSKRLKIFRRFVHRHCLYPLLKIIRNRHSLRNQIITSKMEPLYHRIQDCSIHIKNVKFCVLRQHFTYIIPIHDSEILSMFYDRIYHPFIRSCYTNTIFVSDHPTLYISCYTNLGSIFDHLALTYNLIFFQCITTLYFDSISRVNSTSFFVAAPGSS